MESEQNMAGTADEAPSWQAARLLRAAHMATLATVQDGQPFASLVTPATAPDRSVLLFLSDLSEHTRHLRADPRCSLLVAGAPESANPQTAPRLTVTGLAERIDDEALKARWLARHPYASLYAAFRDFALWQVTPQAGLLVGGFARATRLRRAELAPDPDAAAAILAAEDAIMSHCNDDHADALAAIAGGGAWRMVAVDVDGCDLVPPGEATVLRIAWSAPVQDAMGVRAELVRLAREARA
jgi:putative heme iron utilization protein